MLVPRHSGYTLYNVPMIPRDTLLKSPLAERLRDFDQPLSTGLGGVIVQAPGCTRGRRRFAP